jgi:membrane-bound lytic murein transglycosylase D
MPGDAFAPPRSAWYDERFDPVASTRAYARYMKYLYNQFGDWYLAMAAYDWGAINVQKAVQRTGFADFWELYKRNNLPQETKNYVPIILAVTIMAKNPKQYGLDDLDPDPPLADDTVQTNYSVGLPLVADLVGAQQQQIAALNSSLLRGATPPDETFDLHLPAGTKTVFEKRIGEIPVDKRRYWRYHTVAPGETLAQIARSYHVSLEAIEDVNDLSSTDLTDISALIIPLVPRSATRATTLYQVRRGDTLITIADRFGVTVEELRRWNHLRSSEVKVGSRLHVTEPAHIPTSSGRRAGRVSHSKSSHRGTKRTSSRAAHHRPSRRIH